MSTRNRITPDVAAHNREWPGALTFNAPCPDTYDGPILILATVRLGDHAHVDVYSGRQNALTASGSPVPTMHRGHAGRLILAWKFWVGLRDRLAEDDHPEVLIREVENPTKQQLDMNVR